MNEPKRAEISQLMPHEHQLFTGLGTDFQVLLFPFNMPLLGNPKSQEEGIEIVLIEDNSIDAALIVEVLNESKYKCNPTIRTNCVDALSHLRQLSDSTLSERTLILLDLILPGIDGFQFLTQLRQDPRLKALPVAILTASIKSTHISASAQHSVVSYMTKPGSLKQFRMLTKAFDELLGALFSPTLVSVATRPTNSVSPTFVGQSNEGLTGNPKLG